MVLQQGTLDAGENTENKFKELLSNYKVIREPVHGDIWLTRTEMNIIDSKCFQRLRKIKQLGPANLVYPGAVHTRFDHSIGCVYIAQCIIDSVNKNFLSFFPESNVKLSEFSITAEDNFKIRIVALIHDMAHMSFGHTLEDEGNLFKEKQWNDAQRREKILKRLNPVIEKNMKDVLIPDEYIRKTLGEIESILIAEEMGEESINNLDHPYIADIVGNTICSDLLDYLKRDAYFTGLKLIYDERILSYFVIRNYQKNEKDPEKRRLAILVEKKNLRRDTLSHCVELLRFRYFLAERVYYHKVKVVFSAMIIKMVYCALKAGVVSKHDLLMLGDDVLLEKLSSIDVKERDPNGKSDDKSEYIVAARRIAECLKNRQLYVILESDNEYTSVKAAKVSAYEDAEGRYKLGTFLEELFSLPPGSIIIYCTRKDEGKAAMVKVFRRSSVPQVTTLDNFGNDLGNMLIGDEIRILNKKYSGLWTFYILVNSDYEHKKEEYKKICQEITKGTTRSLIESIVDFRKSILEEHNSDLHRSMHRDEKSKIVNELSRKVETVPREYLNSSLIHSIDEKILQTIKWIR